MRLYRLEEVRRPTKKRPWEWRASWLSSHCWSTDCGGNSKELRDNWVANMRAKGALELGFESETRPGFYCAYYLVREQWPEQILEDLVARINNLESEVRGLRDD